jgi:hypothetical protein
MTMALKNRFTPKIFNIIKLNIYSKKPAFTKSGFFLFKADRLKMLILAFKAVTYDQKDTPVYYSYIKLPVC